MEENNNKCSGHCENCNINQRTYCAAQMAYYAQQEINAIRASLSDFLRQDDKHIILREKTQENTNIEETSVVSPDAELGE